jgi:cation diffusion facilitator CzcD-associated flavoprotein CzcO
LTSSATDIAIVGAGPYGLSIAAYLSNSGANFRIFGKAMQSWREHMPKGMQLKSEGFASFLFDPGSTYTLEHYCAENKLPYADVGIPVPLETFAAYGLEFQKRFVPMLEETNITSIKRNGQSFELQTADGETFSARKVILATGIAHFGHLPSLLAELPREKASHSSEHHDLSKFKGQSVAVIGGGSSATDIAALLHEQGASVHLIARRAKLIFHTRSEEPRPFLQQMVKPRSGLGVGWKSRLCTDAPMVFYRMPQQLRLEIVRRHLGPSGGWFIRDKVVGRFPVHTGATLKDLSLRNGGVDIRFAASDGRETEVHVDHVIGATGFRVSVSRWSFLDSNLRQQIRTVEDSPVLSTNFESSVKGLYIVGLASANCFGPLTRFAYGAKFTAARLTPHLLSSVKLSSKDQQHSEY